MGDLNHAYRPVKARRPEQPDPDAWQRQALCRDEDPDYWFADTGSQQRKYAIKVCQNCPVKLDCLAAALDEEEGLTRQLRAGVRGGLIATQRYELAKQLGKA